jgi:hypothetical protein
MKPLIDGDILRYEIGFSGEIVEEGNIVPLKFQRVQDLLDQKIQLICEEVGATEAPTIFLTGDSYLAKKHLKTEYIPNFREAIAISKGYKGTRVSKKPFHFYNITEYLLAVYDCNISVGLEADDMMCIKQYEDWRHAYKVVNELTVEKKDYNSFNTIICSRDKDLRMCPGWHYSWECGKQLAMGPTYTDQVGFLRKKEDGKVIGYGMKFFLYQMLAGDVVDNIPGCRGVGAVGAFKLLHPITDQVKMFAEVHSLYKEKHGEDFKTYMKEQANLLWMVRELDDKGNPILFSPKREGLI